ncbi:hypothetical protein ACVWVY_007706 [Bradyrhizobium sp. URHC0002]
MRNGFNPLLLLIVPQQFMWLIRMLVRILRE